jgi:ABC-type nitrate/sulfonate/bicarbonate transport system permease component
MKRTREILKFIGHYATYGWLPLLLILLWWYLPNGPSIYFPSLWVVLDNFRQEWLFRLVPSELMPSLEHFAGGYAIAVVGGILIGLLLSLVPLLYGFALPIISFLRGLPSVALIPPLLLVLGIGATFKIGIIVLGAIQPVILNTFNGLQSVDPVQSDTAKVYGLSRSKRITKVLLPAAAPQIVAGARTALQAAILLLVASEIIASTAGVGFEIIQAQQTFNGPAMWSAMFLLGILGIVLNWLFILVERWVLRWYIGMRSLELTR